MDQFTLGDLVILEIALAQFSKDFDISLFASLQMQEIASKIEMNIKKLSQAAEPMRVVPLEDEKNPSPKA